MKIKIRVKNPISVLHPFNSLTINLTNRCNTNCRYCFQGSRRFGKDYIARDDVQRVLEFFSERQIEDERTLLLTGGEIFLHPEIFEIIQLGLSFGYILRLQTNGLLFTEMDSERLRLLSSDSILIKISLDGWNEATHELYRAKGSFSRVVAGIKNIRRWNKNVGIKTVIHKLNLPELYRILDLCLDLGVRSFSYNILRSEGKAKKLKLKRFSELDVIKKLLPYFQRSEYVHLLNGTTILLCCLSKSNVINLGKNFYIDFNGSIYPDQACRKEEKIGSIFEDDLSRQFNVALLNNKLKVVPEEAFNYVKQNLLTEILK